MLPRAYVCEPGRQCISTRTPSRRDRRNELTEHVPEEKVAELDGIPAGEQEAVAGVEEPRAGSRVEEGRREDEEDDGEANEEDGPVDVPVMQFVSMEIIDKKVDSF